MNLSEAYKQGLMDVIKEWLKEQKYVSIENIEDSFKIEHSLSEQIFNELSRLKLIDGEPFYNRGNKVLIYNPFVNIRIYFLDINPYIINAFKSEFSKCEEVEVVLDDFAHFMDTHKDVECIVSPANSFGDMSGGYDQAITDYFGHEVEKEVQKYIQKNLYGEQPVGTAIMVNIPNTSKKLIHAPTMRLPSPIKDPLIIYQCMRTTMMMAINNNIKSIVIPAFGGTTGRVSPSIIAKYMKAGYDQVMSNTTTLLI